MIFYSSCVFYVSLSSWFPLQFAALSRCCYAPYGLSQFSFLNVQFKYILIIYMYSWDQLYYNILLLVFIRPLLSFYVSFRLFGPALAFLSSFRSSLPSSVQGYRQCPSLQVSVSLFVSLFLVNPRAGFRFCSNYVARQYEASTSSFFTWRVSKNTLDIQCSVGFAISGP